jgi:hypothetical protein
VKLWRKAAALPKLLPRSLARNNSRMLEDPKVVLPLASVGIAALALIISTTTAYLTLLREGKLTMTQPSFIAFFGNHPADGTKVYLRTMLYATAKKGKVVEHMLFGARRGPPSIQRLGPWPQGRIESREWPLRRPRRGLDEPPLHPS